MKIRNIFTVFLFQLAIISLPLTGSAKSFGTKNLRLQRSATETSRLKNGAGLTTPNQINDMIFLNHGPDKSLRNYQVNLWPGGVIPVEFLDTPPDRQELFLEKCRLWSAVANVSCIRKTTQTTYVLKVLGAGEFCDSTVGADSQHASIRFGGCGDRSILHEIGHTLGLQHEHQRLDRDQFILLSPVALTYGAYIALWDASELGPYDFLSIMHYSFSEIMQPKAEFRQFIEQSGQRENLSILDAQKMSLLYGPPRMANDQSSGSIVTFTSNCIAQDGLMTCPIRVEWQTQRAPQAGVRIKTISLDTETQICTLSPCEVNMPIGPIEIELREIATDSRSRLLDFKSVVASDYPSPFLSIGPVGEEFLYGDVGDNINLRWMTSRPDLISSVRSSYTVDAPDSCSQLESFPWVVTSATGSLTITALPCHSGRTYTFLIEVTSHSGFTSRSSVQLHVHSMDIPRPELYVLNNKGNRLINSITVDVGDLVSLNWDSRYAVSGEYTYQVSNTNCGVAANVDHPWPATGLSGSLQIIINSCQSGEKYTYKYTAIGQNGERRSTTLKINVRAGGVPPQINTFRATEFNCEGNLCSYRIEWELGATPAMGTVVTIGNQIFACSNQNQGTEVTGNWVRKDISTNINFYSSNVCALPLETDTPTMVGTIRATE